MKKLTPDEASHLKFSDGGNTSKISAMANSLQIGEALVITREDWKRKIPPYRVIRYLEKKSGKKFMKARLADGSGWGIKRVA